MKWISLFSLATLVFSAPSALANSASAEPAYDENTSLFDQMIDSAEEIATDGEPQFSSTREDLFRAKIVVLVNKAQVGSTAQRIRIYQDAELIQEWKVSTGREKVETAKSGRVYKTTTPVGYYRPTKLVENYHSNTWLADMPHAVFFVGGIAIHASTHISDLGKRASGGCVRLSPQNAKTFYELVKAMPVTSVQAISKSGKSLYNKNGSPILTMNRDVLIIVENKI